RGRAFGQTRAMSTPNGPPRTSAVATAVSVLASVAVVVLGGSRLRQRLTSARPIAEPPRAPASSSAGIGPAPPPEATAAVSASAPRAADASTRSNACAAIAESNRATLAAIPDANLQGDEVFLHPCYPAPNGPWALRIDRWKAGEPWAGIPTASGKFS